MTDQSIAIGKPELVVETLMRPEYMHDHDELPHPVQDVPLWSENYLSQAYAPDAGVGLYFHFSRPPFNPHLWHEIFVAYLPGDEFLVAKSFLAEEPGAGPRGAGLSYECKEPFVEWTKTFQGAARRVSGEELRSGPLQDGLHTGVEMEVTYRALAPAFDVGDLSQQCWAVAHYEQHCRVTGHLTYDGQRIELEGTGLRDHSWGPRDLSHMANHVWLHGQFPSGRSFMVIHVPNRSGEGLLSYAVVGDGAGLRRATLVEAPLITEDAQATDPYELQLVTPEGTEAIRAEILQAMPIGLLGPSEMGFGVDRRPGCSHTLYETQARYEWDGEIGYGLSERTVMRRHP